MPPEEKTEKIRQAIMRWRELLDFLQIHLNESEANYQKLFQNLSEEERSILKEKDQQWEIAERIDPEELRRALLRIRFRMRDLERAFEETHDNLVF